MLCCRISSESFKKCVSEPVTPTNASTSGATESQGWDKARYTTVRKLGEGECSVFIAVALVSVVGCVCGWLCHFMLPHTISDHSDRESVSYHTISRTRLKQTLGSYCAHELQGAHRRWLCSVWLVGGFGCTWLVRDTQQSNRELALKEIRYVS